MMAYVVRMRSFSSQATLQAWRHSPSTNRMTVPVGPAGPAGPPGPAGPRSPSLPASPFSPFSPLIASKPSEQPPSANAAIRVRATDHVRIWIPVSFCLVVTVVPASTLNGGVNGAASGHVAQAPLPPPVDGLLSRENCRPTGALNGSLNRFGRCVDDPSPLASANGHFDLILDATVLHEPAPTSRVHHAPPRSSKTLRFFERAYRGAGKCGSPAFSPAGVGAARGTAFLQKKIPPCVTGWASGSQGACA